MVFTFLQSSELERILLIILDSFLLISPTYPVKWQRYELFIFIEDLFTPLWTLPCSKLVLKTFYNQYIHKVSCHYDFSYDWESLNHTLQFLLYWELFFSIKFLVLRKTSSSAWKSFDILKVRMHDDWNFYYTHYIHSISLARVLWGINLRPRQKDIRH